MNKNLFLDFLSNIQGATTLEAQEAQLRSTLVNMGFEGFIYALLPSTEGKNSQEFIACTNFNIDWLSYYGERDLFTNDYAAFHCREKNNPILWSAMFEKIDNGSINERFKTTADATRNWDYGNGLSIPIPHFGSSSAALSVVAKNDFSSNEADRVFMEHEDDLILIANIFHANVDLFAMSSRHYDISDREIEMLKWLSEGYSVKQISHKTCRSVHTINKQIQSAKKRLKCATTSQAVARAVILNII